MSCMAAWLDTHIREAATAMLGEGFSDSRCLTYVRFAIAFLGRLFPLIASRSFTEGGFLPFWPALTCLFCLILNPGSGLCLIA